MKSKKIRYVFSIGREEKLNNNHYAKEFFYGYDFLKNQFDNVDFLEYKGNKNFLWAIFDKILRKLTKLPFYFEIAHNKSNRNELSNSDFIIFTNERLALSSLFMLRKIKKVYDTKSMMITMGLFAKKTDNLLSKSLQNYFIKKILEELNFVVFLSSAEKDRASKNFSEFKDKYVFIPFSIDSKFWVSNNLKNEQKKNILFIGNDGRRDFKKIIQIANELKEYEFTFITSQITKNEILSNNINLVKGHWNLSELTDIEIRKFYDSAKLTLIPLIESYQPSGQSVALQSMSMGVPVLITKTRGFWDFENFENNKHLIFIEDNSLETWVKEIKLILSDSERCEVIKNKSRDLIEKKFDLSKFNEDLIKLIH